MQHSIATDEAGYGPNLGPLVIGASRWTLPSDELDPQTVLSEFVFDRKSNLSKFESQSGSPGLMIADSKAVYSSGKIELLERGVLASLYAIHGSIPQTVGELLQMFGVAPKTVQDDDYFQCNKVSLPLKEDPRRIESAGSRLRDVLSGTGVSLDQLSIAVVFPKDFNSSIETLGNKASCLTAESLSLISRMMDRVEPGGDDCFDIRCDKHGGRNRYAPAIAEHFGESHVIVDEESRPSSRYRFNNNRAKISFSAKGESWLPIALASMCAKYTREVFMLRWNEFWRAHLPHLKPTKGYPVDAKRFKKDIAKVQKKIGVLDNDIWRIR